MRSAAALLETGVWVIGVLIYIWFLEPVRFWGQAWLGILLVYVVISWFQDKPTLREMGWRLDGFPAALRAALYLAILFAVPLLLNGLLLHLPLPYGKMAKQVAGYLGWALLQQSLLQSYVCVRLCEVWEDEWRVAVWAAFLFAVVHVPNPFLVTAGAFLGLSTSLHFCRYRNVPVLALVHALLAVLALYCTPAQVNGLMYVGPRYLNAFVK